MSIELMLVLIIFIIFIGTCVYGIHYLFVNLLNPAGKNADRTTAGTLSKFALTRGFRVISKLRFQFKGREYYIENMLIGYFGILMVHTLGGRGEYYGQIDGKNWQRVLDGKKEVFPNPVLAQEEAMTALRAILSQNKVFNVSMESLVVLTSRSKKTGLFITNDNKIFLPGKLKPYLDKTKFERDTGIDVSRIAAVIEEYRVN